MEFRISDTFTQSLAKLTGEEQKAVKTSAFDLQMNLANPGLRFHKLDGIRDKNFWSVRVNADLRIIVHKTEGSVLLCYVDHHDAAYDWASRRKLETHPKTGAAQLVEIRETIQEVLVPVYVQPDLPVFAKPALFAQRSDEELLGYGVPAEWLADVRAATEDTLLVLADHLPAEAAESLLELATGGRPRVPEPVLANAGPFEHPDAQRRFRVMTNVEELAQALEFPWEKWTIFLHPDQRESVIRPYSGPARISGSAGTGKTVVALHRAAHLARTNPEARVLLTTFSDPLAHALQTQLKRLIGSEPRLAERIDVHSLDTLGVRLYKAHCGPVSLAGADVIQGLLQQAANDVSGHQFTLHFLRTEWEQVMDAWQLKSWEDYRDVARLGRKTRRSEAQRLMLWSIFGRVQAGLAERNLVTSAAVFTELAAVFVNGKRSPFDFAIIDEAQDLAVAHLRFFAAIGTHRPEALFFTGDLGQRIFQQPFSWKSLGIDIRGRSRTLRVNYRTSHQIRRQADRLIGPEVADVDGNAESRGETISVFNGPPPEISVLTDAAAEIERVKTWLIDRQSVGFQPHEMAIFVRSAAQLHRATAVTQAAQLPYRVLDDQVEPMHGHISVGTMHQAKGLEFRAVAVMACDDEVIPLQERIETVADDADLQEVYDTERHLLYVACTRARDILLVAAVNPASEFLDDLAVAPSSNVTTLAPPVK